MYGPESITGFIWRFYKILGSTRMKGGSATKILLELVFARAIYDALRETTPISEHFDTFQILQFFEKTFRETYMHIEQAISYLIEILSVDSNSYSECRKYSQ